MPDQPSITRRLRIVSGGTLDTTRVIDAETGQTIHGVTSFQLVVSEREPASGWIFVKEIEIDLTGDIEIRETDPRRIAWKSKTEGVQ